MQPALWLFSVQPWRHPAWAGEAINLTKVDDSQTRTGSWLCYLKIALKKRLQVAFGSCADAIRFVIHDWLSTVHRKRRTRFPRKSRILRHRIDPYAQNSTVRPAKAGGSGWYRSCFARASATVLPPFTLGAHTHYASVGEKPSFKAEAAQQWRGGFPSLAAKLIVRTSWTEAENKVNPRQRREEISV